LADTTDVEIVDCYFESIETASIRMYRCDDVLIRNTTAIDSKALPYRAWGISSDRSSNITITNCSIARQSGAGISLVGSTDVIIEGSELTSCAIGVKGNSTDNVRVFGNVVSENNLGIKIERSLYWTVHLNNFYWNGLDAQDDGQRRWDHAGYGNYWHVYNGSDSNGDGIGDQPHQVPSSSEDRYPLMGPWNFTRFILIGTFPADGAEGVSVDTLISLTFSCPLRSSTLLSGIITEPIIELSYISMSGMNDKWHVILAVDGGLEEDTLYSITIMSSVMDIFDRNLSNPRTFNFNTRDATAPVIELVSPDNGTLISPGTIIRLRIHDDHLDHLTITSEEWVVRFKDAIVDLPSGNWSDGVMHLEVVAFDMAGNHGSINLSFTVDGTPPAIGSVVPPPGSHVRSGTTLVIEAVDDSPFSITLETDHFNETINGPTMRVDTTGWSEGFYEITLRLVDTADNLAETSLNMTIDDTPPQINLVGPTYGAVIERGTVVTVEVLDPAIGWVNGKVGNGPWSPIQGWEDGIVEVELRTDDEGLVILYISATDTAENAALGSFAYWVDTGPPQISVIPDVADRILNRSTVVTISVKDVSQRTFSVSMDGKVLYSDGSTEVTIDLSVFRDGWHYLEVMATDALDHGTTYEGRFYLDGNPPEIRIIEPSGTYVLNPDASVDVIILDENPGWYVIWVDDVVAFDGNDSSYQLTFNDRSDGAHVIRVRATDRGGNQALDNITIQVDGTPPAIDAVNFEDGSVFTKSKVLVVGITDVNDITAYARMDGGDWVPLSGIAVYTIPFRPTTGVHTIDVMAVDLVNNTAVVSYEVEFGIGEDSDGASWWWVIVVGILLVSIATTVIYSIKRRLGKEEDAQV
jgi:hypothetical protein